MSLLLKVGLYIVLCHQLPINLRKFLPLSMTK